jgi:acetylornithine deacetylase/succinyl-diaminopimelate desuccinylase-like protein
VLRLTRMPRLIFCFRIRMEGTGPHTPVIKDGKLYGRGGADDGYSLMAAINALQVLQSQGLPHARAVILIENCEESGSRDLPYFLDLKKKEVGEPSLVFCLDSGCHNYEVSRSLCMESVARLCR